PEQPGPHGGIVGTRRARPPRAEDPPHRGRAPRLEQQNAYRALSAHPHWLKDVVARLPGDVKPIVTTNERAGRDLAALGGEGPRPRHLPDWHIVSPLPVEVLRAYYAEAEAARGIPWRHL